MTPRGSFSSIARRRCRPTPAGSRHRPTARSSPACPCCRASSGDAKDVPASARRRAPRTSAPWPSRQAKLAPRPSASCASRRPASASPRAGALHQQPAPQALGFLPRSVRVLLRFEFAGQNDPQESRSCQQSHPLSRLKRRPVSSRQDVSHSPRHLGRRGSTKRLRLIWRNVRAMQTAGLVLSNGDFSNHQGYAAKILIHQIQL